MIDLLTSCCASQPGLMSYCRASSEVSTLQMRSLDRMLKAAQLRVGNRPIGPEGANENKLDMPNQATACGKLDIDI